MEDAISDGGYMIPNTHNFPLMIRDVMNITSLSRGNIYTLEKVGGFPRRLSTHSAWGSDSIKLWMQDLLDTRNALPAPFHVSTITLEDRFPAHKTSAAWLLCTQKRAAFTRTKAAFQNASSLAKAAKPG